MDVFQLQKKKELFHKAKFFTCISIYSKKTYVEFDDVQWEGVKPKDSILAHEGEAIII